MRTARATFLTLALPSWRPHIRVQNAFRKIGPRPQPLFYSVCATRLSRSSFQRSAGPLPAPSSCSTRVVKHWNRLPTSIVTAPSANSFKGELDSVWKEMLANVHLLPLLLFFLPPLQFTQSPFTLPHLCYPNPWFTGINKLAKFKIVLFV